MVIIHVELLTTENNTEWNILKRAKKIFQRKKHCNLLTMISSINSYYSAININYRTPRNNIVNSKAI